MNKKVQQKRNQIKNRMGRLTDKDFFLSQSYHDTMLKSVRLLGQKNDITLFMDYEESDDARIAFTNGRLLYLNTANLITNLMTSRVSKIKSHEGFIAHECGHLRCSDFKRRGRYVSGFSRWRVYPKPPQVQLVYERKAWEEMKGYLNAHNVVAASVIQKTASYINNVLEDVYIESFMCQKYPGSIQNGIQRNAALIIHHIPTQEARKAEKSDGLTIMLDMIFRYARAGRTEAEKEYDKQYCSRLNSCRKIIDEAVVSADPDIRFYATNRLMLKLWKYIRQAIKTAAKSLKNEINRLSEEELSKKIQEYLNRKMLWVALSETIGASEEQNEVEEEIEGWDGELEGEPESQNQNGKNEELENALEKMRDGQRQEGGEEETEEGSEIDETLSNLLQKIAEEKFLQDEESDLKRNLEEEAANFKLDGIHKDSVIEMHRMTTVPLRLEKEYKMIAPEINRITRRLEASLEDVLERLEGGTQSGLYMGKRLSRGNLYRLDDKIFEKTIKPEDGFSIAFAVLLDLSGSMSSGGRIESAQKAGLVMYTFCRNLGIPVMLYGHTTHDMGYTEVVDIYSFADFDSVDNQDYLRIMSVSTYDCNRDGVALRFVGQKLLNRPEDIKILLMISDGQPYAQGYKGEIAKADLQEAKYSLEKRGVKLFSAAIGDDRKMIEEIYKDGFLNIADFNTMPVKLAGLIARFIR